MGEAARGSSDIVVGWRPSLLFPCDLVLMCASFFFNNAKLALHPCVGSRAVVVHQFRL